MRLHRFILGLDLTADRVAIVDRETTNQILNVFRLTIGDTFVVCDGKGTEATARIIGADKVIEAELSDRRTVRVESASRVLLYCAMLKRENFELVVQKATECGVAEIVPIVTERTVKLGARLDRLQKIAREAAEQSGRGIVPIIHEPIPLTAAILHAKLNAVNVLFEPNAEPFHPSQPLQPSKPSQPLGLFIGPEGGWDTSEVERLRAEGYHVASLGPRILRAETAAIVAVFLATGIENGEWGMQSAK